MWQGVAAGVIVSNLRFRCIKSLSSVLTGDERRIRFTLVGQTRFFSRSTRLHFYRKKLKNATNGSKKIQAALWYTWVHFFSKPLGVALE